MKTARLEKVVFFLSTVVLAIFYGYGASVFGWYPGPFLESALKQTGMVLEDPHYLGSKIHGHEGVRLLQPDKYSPGFTLLSTHFEEWDWQAGFKLVNRRGEVLHQWRIDRAELFPKVAAVRGVRTDIRRGVHGSFLFPNGDVLFNSEYLGVARIDACGNVLWRHQNGAHHSVERTDEGAFWIPITDSAAIPNSVQYPKGYPGLGKPLNHDRLLLISEDGEPLDSISVLDVLFRNGLQRYLIKARTIVSTDRMHVNDVEPLPANLASQYPLFEPGDLLVSLRASDLVLVIDPETEEVRWYVSDPLVQQHDPDYIGDGWIGIFNNNWDSIGDGTLLGGSEILAIRPHTGEMRTLHPIPESDYFYTPFLGKWQLLPGGNMLLTEGRTGRILEVDQAGQLVWEWVNPKVGETRVVEVTEGTRYDYPLNQVLSWACSALAAPADAPQGGTRK